MNNSNKQKTARETIDEFFSNLNSIEEIDKDVVNILQRLQAEGKLGRDELLSALQEARNKENSDDTQKI